MTHEITFDSVREAISCLDVPTPPRYDKLLICRKHWKILRKALIEKAPNFNPVGMPSLDGIEVIIKPYLKKARLVRKDESQKTI